MNIKSVTQSKNSDGKNTMVMNYYLEDFPFKHYIIIKVYIINNYYNSFLFYKFNCFFNLDLQDTFCFNELNNILDLEHF